MGLHAVSGLLLDGDALAGEARAPATAVEAGSEPLGQPLGGQQPDEGGPRWLRAGGDAAGPGARDAAGPGSRQTHVAGASGSTCSCRGHGQRLHGHGRSAVGLALLLGGLQLL